MRVNRPSPSVAPSGTAPGKTTSSELLFRNRVPAGTERRLLEAALDCFAREGYHGTSTRDIARRARMSPAAIYLHYESKEELLFIIAQAVASAMLARLEEIAAVPAAPAERLRRLVEAHATFHATMSKAVRVASYELYALSPAKRRKVVSIYRRTKAIVRAAVDDGIAAGAFASDNPTVATTAILSAGIAVSRWYAPRGRLSAAEVGALYGEMALRMLTLPASPSTRARRAANGPATRPSFPTIVQVSDV